MSGVVCASLTLPSDRSGAAQEDEMNKLLWLPPVVQGVFAPFAHVIDCELLSGLWVQPCQKLLAGMVIRGSG
ncbi:MAG: hypothetical protein Q8O82_07005, partial [Pseudorhodobacter sp.]|nr:hypothetical protein [Pseudorhodobacter sp.]